MRYKVLVMAEHGNYANSLREIREFSSFSGNPKCRPMNGVRHVEHILRLFSFSVNHLLDIMLLNYEYFSDADDFEPPAPVGPATDKWEGEDDDDVKVSHPLQFR